MVLINVARREVECKLVFYGPGMSGKTTNLEQIYKKAPDDIKGKMTTIATEGDRTLFFDLLPLDLGEVAGMRTKFKVYTVPGQSYYSSTRRLVLQGVDGVVFVADSAPTKMKENIESLDDLVNNLRENGKEVMVKGSAGVPLVLQWNKRDLPVVATEEELGKTLNRWNCPAVNAVAFKGEGVMQTLKAISGLVIEKINEEYGSRSRSSGSVVRPASPPSQSPAGTGTGQAPAASPAAPPPAAGPAPSPPPPAPVPKPVAPPPPPPAPKPPAPAVTAKPAPPPIPARPAAPPPVPAAEAPKKKGCGGAAALLLAVAALAAAAARAWLAGPGA